MLALSAVELNIAGLEERDEGGVERDEIGVETLGEDASMRHTK